MVSACFASFSKEMDAFFDRVQVGDEAFSFTRYLSRFTSQSVTIFITSARIITGGGSFP